MMDTGVNTAKVDLPDMLSRCVAAVVLLAMFVVLAICSRCYGVSHDEHQFIAAALLAHQGVFPVVDYIYFHMPLHALAMAPLVKFDGNPIVNARLLTLAAACAGLLLSYGYAVRVMRDGGVGAAYARFATISSLVLVAMTLPFLSGASRTWNHATATALALGSLYLVTLAVRRDSAGLACVAGVAASLSLSFRLALAPILLPLALGLLVLDEGLTWRRAARWLAIFALGVGLGITPVAWFAMQDPLAFWMGNFGYPRIHAHFVSGDLGASTGWRSRWSGHERIFSRDFSLFGVLVVGVASIGISILAALRRWRGWRPLVLVTMMFAAAVVGGLAPEQTHPQYHFATVSFLALLIATAVGILAGRGPAMRYGSLGIVAAAAVCVAMLSPLHIGPSIDTRHGLSPQEALGIVSALRSRLTPGAYVVTLSPMYPLMANAKVDPVFVHGTFAWRTAHYVDPAMRAQLRWFGPDDIDEIAEAMPIDAILTGIERPDNEKALVEFAKRAGFRPAPFDAPVGAPVLWVPSVHTDMQQERR